MKTALTRKVADWLEGESLFNDAMAIVLYGLMLSLLDNSETMPLTTFELLLGFTWVFIGGLMVGLMAGVLSLFLLKRFKQDIQAAVITLAFAYGSYVLADQYLKVSGIIAVLVCGLAIGTLLQQQNRESDSSHRFVSGFWQLMLFIADAMAFLLVGITITFEMFRDGWAYMMLGIVIVFMARLLSIHGLLPLINSLIRRDVTITSERIVLTLGSQRGAITAVLALSLPLTLPGWWIAQTVGYGVVIFSLFIQGPLLPVIIRRID